VIRRSAQLGARPAPVLNVTALVDVLLVLLVLLMLTAPLALRRLSVSVPHVSPFGTPHAIRAVLALELDAAGRWHADGATSAFELLAPRVAGARVELAADGLLPYETVARALAQLRNADAAEIALVLR